MARRRRAHGRVATVAVDAMQFLKPVKIGDVVSIHSVMQREGRSSMKIGVEVWVTRMPAADHLKVTEAVFTFVAIGEGGQSRPLPGLAASPRAPCATDRPCLDGKSRGVPPTPRAARGGRSHLHSES